MNVDECGCRDSLLAREGCERVAGGLHRKWGKAALAVDLDHARRKALQRRARFAVDLAALERREIAAEPKHSVRSTTVAISHGHHFCDGIRVFVIAAGAQQGRI